MKKIWLIMIMLLITISMTFGGGEGENAPAKKVVLRLAETHPADYPTTKADYEFARLVGVKTNGRITVEVYHSRQLGEEKAVIEQVQLGGIDFTRVSLAPVAAFVRELDALQLPYLYKDGEHMWKVLNGSIGQGLLQKMDAFNFVGLCYFDSGARNFYTRKQIKTVEDMKGLKIRVQQSPLMITMIEAINALPTPLAFGEVYSGLQTGTIDGAENNWSSYLTQSHFETAPFLLTNQHIRIPEILMGSKKGFDKLSKADQDLIRQAAKETVPFQIKAWADYEQVAEKTVKEKGATITICPPEEIAKFRNAMQAVYAKQPPELLAVVKQIQDMK
jgi:tripartite ATP-independent transporter DctP family solute receptor